MKIQVIFNREKIRVLYISLWTGTYSKILNKFERFDIHLYVRKKCTYEI